jgi:hypothetical protein
MTFNLHGHMLILTGGQYGRPKSRISVGFSAG